MDRDRERRRASACLISGQFVGSEPAAVEKALNIDFERPVHLTAATQRTMTMLSARDRGARRRNGAPSGIAMAAVLCLAGAFPAHAQDLDWAKGAGGTGTDFAFGIATDAAGNSYVSGGFSGTATFGPGEANETTLTSAGSNDIFVARYDASGALVWAKRAGSADFDRGAGIATNGAGNSYVTGLFSGTATFGPGEPNETTLTAAGPQDIFVAKYDTTGALIWARRADGADLDQGLGIGVDSAGNSYVTGVFSGTTTFGPGEVNQTTLAAAASLDIFVARYDPGGALVWATRAAGTGLDEGRGIATDGAGNSYVTGRFSGTATFGAGETSETTLTSAGDFDIFVARYDPSGALVWAKRAGGGAGALGWGVATDAAGNSYVTGAFSGTATFGAGEANETVLSGGSEDIFVARYDASGALVWAKRAGGGGGARGLGVATDGAGNSYVTGAFEGTATFGPGEANETTLTSAGAGSDDGDPSDIFVASYDFSGALVWAKRAGGADGDQGLAIATDGAGNSYATGFFSGTTATFGAGETNETTLTSAGGLEIFVARFSGARSTPTATASPMTTTTVRTMPTPTNSTPTWMAMAMRAIPTTTATPSPTPPTTVRSIRT